jgi:hypothetical protein
MLSSPVCVYGTAEMCIAGRITNVPYLQRGGKLIIMCILQYSFFILLCSVCMIGSLESLFQRSCFLESLLKKIHCAQWEAITLQNNK